MWGANHVGILAHLVHHNVSHGSPVPLKLHADGPRQHLHVPRFLPSQLAEDTRKLVLACNLTHQNKDKAVKRVFIQGVDHVDLPVWVLYQGESDCCKETLQTV